MLFVTSTGFVAELKDPDFGMKPFCEWLKGCPSLTGTINCEDCPLDPASSRMVSYEEALRILCRLTSLLPCPFCGVDSAEASKISKIGKRPTWEVSCGNCRASIVRGRRMDAVMDWNTRKWSR